MNPAPEHDPTPPSQPPEGNPSPRDQERSLKAHELPRFQALESNVRQAIRAYYSEQEWDPFHAEELLTQLCEERTQANFRRLALVSYLSQIYSSIGFPIETAIVAAKRVDPNDAILACVDQHFKHGCRFESFLPGLVDSPPEVKELYWNLTGGMGFDMSLEILADPDSAVDQFHRQCSKLRSLAEAAIERHGYERAVVLRGSAQNLVGIFDAAIDRHQIMAGHSLIALSTLPFELDESQFSSMEKWIKHCIKRCEQKNDGRYLECALDTIDLVSNWLSVRRAFSESQEVFSDFFTAGFEMLDQVMNGSRYATAATLAGRIDIIKEVVRSAFGQEDVSYLKESGRVITLLSDSPDSLLWRAVISLAKSELPAGLVEMTCKALPHMIVREKLEGMTQPCIVVISEPSALTTEISTAFKAGVETSVIEDTLSTIGEYLKGNASVEEKHEYVNSKLLDMDTSSE